MNRLIILPAIALMGVFFAAWTVVKGNRPVPISQPVAQPAATQFTTFIAGAGLVEPSSELIAIGTPVPGIVAAVPVTVGDQVTSGAILFQLDDRAQQAQLKMDEAAVLAANAQLNHVLATPRAEDLPVIQARVAQAAVATADAKSQLALAESITVAGAISVDALNHLRFAVAGAEARHQEALAELNRLKAGPWSVEVAVAQAQVTQAQAKVAATRVEIERTIIRASRDAQVLQVRIRVGEFAPAGVVANPLMLLGSTKELHVRIDIDENDAWRLKPGAEAECYVRGNNRLHTTLRFVRSEPYVIPKRSLTGESAERVDTRVLQVIYAFDPSTLPVRIGQQVDAFVAADAITDLSIKPVVKP
jgi:multidrug efflux pump subunit AcrA (membrane-fusion protein)